MVDVYNRNVVSNFKYIIKAVTIFISRIVLKRLNADHKLLFRKLKKDLMYYTKLNADIQFTNTKLNADIQFTNTKLNADIQFLM